MPSIELRYAPDDAVEGGVADVPSTLEELPPLPRPNYGEMRSQATMGTVVVLGITGLLVGIPYSSTQLDVSQPLADSSSRSIAMGCLYIEAVIAIICLIGILFGDPGTLKRTPETCFPLPQVVVEHIRSGTSLSNVDNVYQDGQVFCVRCCIWRPDPVSYRQDNTHHCSICQRCVRDFDHHCGVFGRCIAGEGMRGNMGYFKTILMMFMAGFITCIIATSTDAPLPEASPSP